MMTINLSDTHLVILSAAAARADRLILPVPPSVKARGKVLDAVLKKLLRLELVEACEVKKGDPGWDGRDQDPSPTGLRLAAKGFKALGVLPIHENGEDVTKEASDDGPRCIECGAKAADADSARLPANMFPPEPDILGPLTKSEEVSSKTARPVKAGSKEGLLLETLKEPNGASVFDMMEVTGWLPHTCRAALTRLRQKGYAIDRIDDPETGSRYCVTTEVGALK